MAEYLHRTGGTLIILPLKVYTTITLQVFPSLLQQLIHTQCYNNILLQGPIYIVDIELS